MFTTLPIESLDKNSYLLLEIDYKGKMMSVYCSYLGFSSVPWFNNNVPDFLGILFENLPFREGCFYYNLNPYSTTSLYKFSKKEIELGLYNTKQVLEINSIFLEQNKIDCNAVEKSFTNTNTELGLFPTLKIDVSLMSDNKKINSNVVRADTYLFIVADVNGYEDFFGAENFFRYSNSFNKSYIHIPLKNYNKSEIIKLKIKEFKSQKKMNLWIRIARAINENDEIILENWVFREGDYLYNLNDKKIKYDSDTVIDLSHLNKHKISKDKLNEISEEKE